MTDPNPLTNALVLNTQLTVRGVTPTGDKVRPIADGGFPTSNLLLASRRTEDLTNRRTPFDFISITAHGLPVFASFHSTLFHQQDALIHPRDNCFCLAESVFRAIGEVFCYEGARHDSEILLR